MIIEDLSTDLFLVTSEPRRMLHDDRQGRLGLSQRTAGFD